MPGEVVGPDDPVPRSPGRPRRTLVVENTGDRPVQVGSHFHLAEANPALDLDRAAARGWRLDVPAGTSVRFEPGIAQEVTLVPLGGRRIVAGLRGEVAGPLDVTEHPDRSGRDA
ncbi:urease subunit beta [Iamia sp. SCSIO 61187]|uniref:urease subunit beta n=1 Tax=Iamia sp. SCSIO 61187 TaxID=2722752 RepID=UPI001C62E251|nr:urease subunit beta [Iamia sp. SCSIO 61187]